MLQLIKQNRSFLVPYIIFLLIGLAHTIIYSKPELHILSNEANTPFQDTFFRFVTNLGDGALIAVLFIVLLFWSYRNAFTFLTGSLLTALIINLFKKVLLEDVYRPSKYFELFETYQLHFVEGVQLHSYQSFPSGHTGTAFNLFFMLALLSKGNSLKLFFLFVAAIVGYSRVYLSQHFVIDILAGSFIGTTVMLITYYWFLQRKGKWLDYSVIGRK